MKKGLMLGVVFFLIGFTILSFSFYQDIQYAHEDEKMLEDFFASEYQSDNVNMSKNDSKTNDSENYINSYLAVIEIPSLNLKTGIVMSNSSFTTMDRNVSIYPTSTMPDQHGNFILFAHSGNSRTSYFKNIWNLKIEDEIYIYYHNVKYVYKVSNVSEVSMYNNKPIENEGKDKITLITCNPQDNSVRIVVQGEKHE